MSRYQGSELDLFAAARRWKDYFAAAIRPYLRGAVLEVGAGIGTNTALLAPGRQGSWLCVEPDPGLADRIRGGLGDGSPVAVRTGTLADLGCGERFDTILYLDVLEHIADDRGELERAANHLAAGGHLVILAPAHMWLYSPFDRAIGHFRRYTRRGLAAIMPPRLKKVELRYMDSVGLLASAANRFLLNQAAPGPSQIATWDGWMVPISRRLDPLLGGRVGKSVLGVWHG